MDRSVSTACRLAPGLLALALALPGRIVAAAGVPLPQDSGRGIVPGAFPAAPPETKLEVPAELLLRRDRLSIVDVLDVALRNDPSTQIAWRDARAQADALRVAKADWWPELDLTLGGTRAKSSVQGGRFNLIQTTYGPGVALSYVLADFGERSGGVAGARADAFAAVWAHGAAVQSTVLRTVEAYVSYVDAKALLVAARTSEDEAKAGLDAAQQRREAGVATIADVLQSRTALSQSKLDALTIEGSIGSLRGALATAMGLPANVPFEVGVLPAEMPTFDFGGAADEAIARALSRRPDLAASREAWLSATANVKETRGSWLPKLNLTGSANRNYYDPQVFASKTDTWSRGLQLRIPIWNGLRNKYEVAKAREEESRAAAQAREVEQDVVNDVWSSWYQLQTAVQRIDTTKDLLASATESEEVALGRYKEGVGTLLDLLNAQASLARARAQEISARADWLVSAARLLYSTGSLTGPEAVPSSRSPEVLR